MKVKLTQAITYESKLAKIDTVLNVSDSLGETLIKNNMAILSNETDNKPIKNDKENKTAFKEANNKREKNNGS